MLRKARLVDLLFTLIDMTDYTEVNKWVADKCGVITPVISFKNTKRDYWWKLSGKVMSYKWSIEDAECRELIFNWLLNSNYCLFYEKHDNGISVELSMIGNEPDTILYCKSSFGKSKSEAEKSCLISLWEASKDE